MRYLIAIHDIGELADGRPYLILDLADRGTLSERLVEMQGVDSISVKSIVDALTESLSALHSAGFVHRDVTPKNLLIKRIGSVSRIPNRVAATVARAGLIGADERVFLGDLGLAKDFLSNSEATVIAGTPQFRAPEQMQMGAEIGESTDVYAATAVIWNVIAGTPPPENHPMDRALDTIDSEWKAFMSQGLSLDPADRFADMRAWQASAEAAISAGSDFIQTSNAIRYRTDLCPYQGLSSFQPEDANRFFGRDQLVKDLVTRLRNRHVMVVAGASGSGKSSLVRAGLISAVRSGVLPDSDRWPVVLFTPGSDPLAELDYQIAKVLGRLQAQENSLASASSDHRWRAISDTITETAGGGLVCIDQFEELFTFDHHSNVVEEFLLALQAMVEPADSKIHLVLIIRADFYARSSRYPWLAKIINENQLLVGPMSRTELRDAIVTPAKIATLKLDDELVDSVLDEAGSAAGSLPLVSHALVETWKRRSGRRLTIESYRSTGGVAGAIGQSAETLYNEQLTTDQQSAARRLVLRLVSPGEGIPDTRRPIAITDLDGDSHPEVMHDVANALVEARLLTIDRNTIQLAHEAIITSWPRLRDWINDSREDLRIQQRIERASAEWLESDRNPDLLYRGTPLTAARDWQSKRGQDLNIQEREFLDTAADREHANLARAQAAAQRIRTQRRLAFTTLTILTVAALVLSVVAFTAFHRATNNEKAANQRLAQALASQAVELVNQNPRLALALAAEVIERTEQPPVEARIALVNATNSLSATPYTPASIPKVVGDTLTVGVHPSEEFVVTGNRDGSVAFWTAQGQASGEPFKAHDGAVEEIVFSKNGAQMLTAGLGGKVMRWDLSNQGLPSSPTEMIDLNSILWSVAVSAETGRLATATEDGKIRLFDLNNMTELAVMVDLDRDFISVQFSPDGHLLFAGNGRGEVWSWQVSTGEQLLTPFRAHQSDIWEIVFHPEKAIFVTASSDGRVRIWNLETGALINEPFTGVAENVRGVQISKNGLLIAGDENGRILFWDINSQTFKGATTASHNSQVIDASLQQNGSLLVSLGFDHVLRTWRQSDEGPSRQMVFQEAGAYGLSVSGDGQRIATGDGVGQVRVFDSATNKLIGPPFTLDSSRIWALALDHNAEAVVAGDQDGNLGLWDIDSGRLIASVKRAHEGAITSVAFDHGNSTLLSAGSDGVIRQWNAQGLTSTEKIMTGHEGGVTRIAFSPDGKFVGASDRAGKIRIWNYATSEIDRQWQADDNTVWSLAWSPDGTRIVTAHADESVILWQLDTEKPINEMTPHPGGATDVVFLADGKTIASTSRDGTLRLWDVEFGLHIGKAMGLSDETQWRMVSNKSTNTFITSRSNGAVEVWNVLDIETACKRSIWNQEAQRRYLGEGESPKACAGRN